MNLSVIGVMMKNKILNYLKFIKQSNVAPYVTFDELKEKTKLNVIDLNYVLPELESEGKISKTKNGWFIKGKAYANKKSKNERPKLDNYHTPQSLVWELLKCESFNNVLEPACGGDAIVNAMPDDIECESSDITTGKSFFDYDEWNGDILTNPPFFLWDKFVKHALNISPKEAKICMLGRMNYFGTHSRNINGVFDHLAKVYIFDRMIDYRTPYRDDGLFHVGAMVTGWFLWDKTYIGDTIIKRMDVQKYAKLGPYDVDEYRLLGYLQGIEESCENPYVGIDELSDLMSMDKVLTTKILNSMNRKGFVNNSDLTLNEWRYSNG